MTTFEELIKTYIAQKGLQPAYAEFCHTINDASPKTGISVDLGAQNDVFHGLLLGADEHVMIDNNYDAHEGTYTQREFDYLSISARAIEREIGHDSHKGTTLAFNLEGERKIYIVNGDAANYADYAKEYSAALVKGPRINGGTKIRDVVGEYLERVTTGSIYISSQNTFPSEGFSLISEGPLLFEYMNGMRQVLTTNSLYRKK